MVPRLAMRSRNGIATPLTAVGMPASKVSSTKAGSSGHSAGLGQREDTLRWLRPLGIGTPPLDHAAPQVGVSAGVRSGRPEIVSMRDGASPQSASRRASGPMTLSAGLSAAHGHVEPRRTAGRAGATVRDGVGLLDGGDLDELLADQRA